MRVLESFEIIKFLNPIWYFNLYPENAEEFSSCYFNSAVMQIPDEAKSLISTDERYSNNAARELDLGFQAWNRGAMMKVSGVTYEKLTHREKPNRNDEYIFIRKYYKSHRVYYFFLKNIFSFRNPLKEITALKNTRDVKKVDLVHPHCDHKGYEQFNSMLVESNPFVSVIIPTLNRYEFLRDALDDLKKQSHGNFDVIVIDQTDNPDKKFYEQFSSLNLKVIYQKGKGQWLARNEAVRNTKSDFLLFFDDDSRIGEDWIEQHLKGMDYFKADVSAGVSISKVGDRVPENYSFFRWADQFDSGNAMVKRKVFEKVGMFDRQFDRQRMGDGEFGLRAYLAGFKSISHPLAKRIHLKIGSGGLRQLGSWDAFRPKKFFSPRPLPSVLYLYRKYYPKSYVSNALLIGMLPSLIPYKWKSKKYLYPLGALLSLFLFPLLLIQLANSWNLSGTMLREGDKIERL